MSRGSHSTWPEWAPRTCSVCGERITLAGKNARGAVFAYNVPTDRGYSRHADCRPRRRRAAR